jgi:phage head maturation protease
MEQLELRFIDAKLTSTETGLKVSGYVNKTNQWSEVLGVRKKFVERILPGTFTRALQAGNEIHFLAEHDNAKILSSTMKFCLTTS